ncbi:DUF29 domain-containing protein [Methylobacterium oryzihabitans]|uniref:DUF29 domain-containing protein n=1 Tax=Methylobacterium oryzihabitans TaxID=2499852 RepID=A0A3S3U3G4_9HYPH|nr:DUF29 domain-containing protein [Methylobacterium oryzihabitans]RVU14627.1 DUF29 domain-containing protein [Methylobacterium oryzihabitans]
MLDETLRRPAPADSDGSAEPTHDGDTHAWAQRQAEHLRRRDWARLDPDNLADEIEEMGRELYNKLESALRIILLHLLKWDHQPGRRTRSWTVSIRTQRIVAARLLDRHGSLRGRFAAAVDDAYRLAAIEAAGETGLDDDVFPETCPYTTAEIMTREIPWPAGNGDA